MSGRRSHRPAGSPPPTPPPSFDRQNSRRQRKRSSITNRPVKILEDAQPIIEEPEDYAESANGTVAALPRNDEVVQVDWPTRGAVVSKQESGHGRHSPRAQQLNTQSTVDDGAEALLAKLIRNFSNGNPGNTYKNTTITGGATVLQGNILDVDAPIDLNLEAIRDHIYENTTIAGPSTKVAQGNTLASALVKLNFFPATSKAARHQGDRYPRQRRSRPE